MEIHSLESIQGASRRLPSVSSSGSAVVPDVSADQDGFDFDGHRRAAIEEYQRLRPIYEAYSEVVRSILTQALRRAGISVASIEARAKTVASFGDKAGAAADENPNAPRYENPLEQITDLAAARVITFFLRTLKDVDRIINTEFRVLEKIDKSDLLMRQERLGYHSVHYVVQLRSNRSVLSEYARYDGLRAEIQLRTVLQHAWAEIEHDIQYKAIETIPLVIRRRFMALAGLLEIADREFQEVQLEDERLREIARVSVAQGHLESVEITGDALKAYLDQRLGPDGRIAKWAYDYTAVMLRRLGFRNFQEVDECISGYDSDLLSRTVHGTRQGQLTRFEDMLQGALGNHFIDNNSLSNSDWWRQYRLRRFHQIVEAGFPTNFYRPPGIRENSAGADDGNA